MKKISKISILVAMSILIATILVWALRPNNWDRIGAFFIVKSLGNKSPVNLDINEKIVLFRSYMLRKDIVNALKIASTLEPNVSQLSKAERIHISGETGRILRADNEYELERKTYDIFLKEKDPEFHHFFRAVSYGTQHDEESQKMELLEAKRHATDTKMIESIDTLLLQIKVQKR